MHWLIEAPHASHTRQTHERFVNDYVCALDQFLMTKFATFCLSVSTEFRFFALPRAHGISIYDEFFFKFRMEPHFFLSFVALRLRAHDPKVLGFHSFFRCRMPSYIWHLAAASSTRARTRYDILTAIISRANLGDAEYSSEFNYFHVATSN